MSHETAKLEQEGVGTSELDQEAISEGVSQVGIGIIMVLAALIGLWGIGCLVGGVSASNGVVELMRNWLGAVSGM